MTEPARLHDDDIPVDTDLARQLVDEQFPEWAHLPLRRVASSGTVNAIFRLGDDLVIRLPRAESYVWDLETLGASDAWLRWAAPRLPLTIPEPVAIAEATDRYPWPWPIHRWIEGAALDSVDLTSSARAAEQLAEFVLALRRLPDLDGPRSVKAISRNDWDPIFRRVLGDLDGVVDTRRALRAWEHTMEAESWSGQFGWVHADLLPGNLLARNGDLVAVVDFECLGTGDPAVDIASAWANFDQPTRQVFREAADVDEHSWLRAANYALRAVMGVRYYEHTNPRFSQLALRTVTEVTDEVTSPQTASGPQHPYDQTTRPATDTQVPRVRIRPATSDDVDFLVDVVIEATRAQGRWPADLDDAAFRDQFTARTNQEVHGDVGASTTSVVEVDGQRVGRLRVVRGDGRIEVAGMQLLPSAQNQGIGSTLIADLKTEATQASVPLELSVEHDNPHALRLYIRLGLQEVSRDPREARLRWSHEP